ncbi:MAG: hypothetical protein ABMA64_36615 [Myxococcota bacterium]
MWLWLVGCPETKSETGDSGSETETAIEPGESGETGDSGAPPAPLGPTRGLLQFHLVHDLEDDGCLAAGDCFLTIEERDDVDGWIDALAADADAPVLHWDQGVPWSVFAAPVPAGEDPDAFYRARLDPELVAWVDAYAAWFAEAGRGYLAVSILDGTRSGLAADLHGLDAATAIGSPCGDFSPGATHTAADGTPFALGPTYTAFVTWLARAVRPDQLGLMVELNLLRDSCPGSWDGAVDSYHQLYDAARAELGPEVALFPTLSLPPLLGYEDGCMGELAFVTCDQEPPAPPVVDPATCFPGDPTALDDLAEGGRVDVLALSLYPEGLGMALPGDPDPVMRVWDPAALDGPCAVQAQLPAWVDPLPSIAALGWDGPVAMAETSARSCPSTLWYDDGTTALVASMPGSDAGQAAWVELIRSHDEWRFVNQSFLRDYPPLGTWTVEQGVLDPVTFSLFNLWACSGLYTADGEPKPALAPWRAP